MTIGIRFFQLRRRRISGGQSSAAKGDRLKRYRLWYRTANTFRCDQLPEPSLSVGPRFRSKPPLFRRPVRLPGFRKDKRGKP